MLIPFTDLAHERYKPLTSPLHVGTVLFNNDPDQLGGVKANIPGVLDFTTEEELPWIYPVKPWSVGGASNSANIYVPEVGSQLLISFPYEGEPLVAFYYGYFQHKSNLNPCLQQFYPNLYGFQDSDGTTLAIIKELMKAIFQHASGLQVTVDADGNLNVDIPKDVKITIGGNVKIVVDQDVESTVQGERNTHIEGSDNLRVVTNQRIEVTGAQTIRALGAQLVRSETAQEISSGLTQLIEAAVTQYIQSGGLTHFNLPGPSPLVPSVPPPPIVPPIPEELFCA